MLLCSSATRYLLVAAQINHWITSDIFHFHIVRGFSDQYDTILLADHHRQERHDASSSTNITLRRAFAQALADGVRDLMSEPGFGSWLDSVFVSTSLLFTQTNTNIPVL